MDLSIGEEKAKFSTARIMVFMTSPRAFFHSAIVAATAACLLLPAPQALAWGHEGHRIIADIAWDHLSDATLEKLEPFLGDNDLASISTWADDIRHGRPETAPWHYVDIAPNSGGYNAAADCPNDDCIVAQIGKFARILGDTTQPMEARAEALKFVVHFTGDITQPMHAMADAKGGNGIPVAVFGATQCGKYPCNLHSVWDTELIEHSGVREHRYTRQLERMIAAKHLKPGAKDPAAWANDSLKLAERAWVQPDTDIDEAYFLREKPVVDKQLALAGLRLARLLNEELGGTTKR